MRYLLYAHWRNGQIERIDEVTDLQEAEQLAAEYRLAYGPAASGVSVVERGWHGSDSDKKEKSRTPTEK